MRATREPRAGPEKSRTPRSGLAIPAALGLMVVMVVAMLFGGSAVAAGGPDGGFVIPAGATASFTNVRFCAGNQLSWGYQLHGGTDQTQYTRSGGCEDAAPDVTIGPFATSTTLLVFLRDDSCNRTYYSNGLPVDHVAVEGADPFSLRLADSGGGCVLADDPWIDNGGYNFRVSLQIGAAAAASTTQLVSATPSGNPGNSSSQLDSLARHVSDDGNLVVFASYASNLVPGGTNGDSHIFVRNRAQGITETELISVSWDGGMANNRNYQPTISGNGRYVAFLSYATNLVDPSTGVVDSNNTGDVYVRDLQLDETYLVSVATDGTQGNEPSERPSMSDDGRYVAFDTGSSTLLPPGTDTNGTTDVYIRDRQQGTTSLVSVRSDGVQGNGSSNFPSLSSDGTVVGFATSAANFLTGTQYGGVVRDLSVASGWTLEQVPGTSGQVVVSGDGRYAAFTNDSQLVPEDTNASTDAYRYDRQTSSVDLVSRGVNGEATGAGGGAAIAIDDDGSSVVFTSFSDQLLPAGQDTNGVYDVFVWTAGGSITRASLASDGAQADAGASEIGIDGSGSVVVFSSYASNLVPPVVDTLGLPDVFVRVMSSGPTLRISGVAPVANSVGQFNLFEASFDLDRSYANPFDPNQISVDVTFTSPTGKVSVVPAFWYQEFIAASDLNGNENYTPVGAAGWRVRFAPAEIGTYTYSINAEDAVSGGSAGPFTFAATASSQHGFVRLDTNDPRYMRYDDGTPYLPRGHNAAFEDRPPFQGGLSVYRPLFASFAAAHENWTRVWMTDFNRSAIEWGGGHWSGLYGGPGVYSLPSAWRWDKLLDRAATDGLEVQMVFNDHGQFSNPGSNLRWDQNPYNEANGGPVPSAHPEQFFSNQAAKDLYKQRLRYVVARWGAYPNVLAWELFNEIQFLGDSSSNPMNDPQMAADVQAWHIEMATYLKSIDPFQHLVTTSSDAPGLTAPIWSDPHFDLVQVHDYGGPPMSRFAQTIESLRNTYDKPVIYGEFGLGSGDPEAGFDPTTFGGSTANLHHLQQATHLRNAVWASALSGSGAMSWWWGTYIAADSSWHRSGPDFPANERIFPALDAFIGNVDFVQLGLQSSQLTPSSGLFAVGMNNATKAFEWVQDVDSEYGSGVDPASARVSGGTIEIAGMQNGDYTADVYATSGPGGVVASFAASAAGGTLHLALPNFLGDIAVKVRPGPPQRPTNVVAAGGDGQAAVTWSPPAASPLGSITSYSVIPRDETSASNLTPVSVSGTDAIVGGLMNGHNYTFTVVASNAVGAGPASLPSNEVTPASGAATPTATSGSTSDTSGGTVTTGTVATTSDPLVTSVAVPPGTGDGTVSIAEGNVTTTAPSGYEFLNTQINIVSTANTTSALPLSITFTIDGSLLSGYTPATLAVLRTESGVTSTVPACTSSPPTTATPDPCIPTASRIWTPDPVTGPDVQFTVLTSKASEWNISPLPATAISVSDTGYAPKVAQALQSQRVTWSFQSTKLHSATDASGLGPNKAPLFDSGRKTSGSYSYRFLAAGTYSYRSTVSGDTSFTGSVGIPMQASATSIPNNTDVVLTWSSPIPPTGYAFDVQYRFKAAGSTKWSGWTIWKKSTTTTAGTFRVTKRGTYDFRSRLRNTSTGRESLYSPYLYITAT